MTAAFYFSAVSFRDENGFARCSREYDDKEILEAL